MPTDEYSRPDLRARRKALGLELKELGEIAGVRFTLLSRIELGRSSRSGIPLRHKGVGVEKVERTLDYMEKHRGMAPALAVRQRIAAAVERSHIETLRGPKAAPRPLCRRCRSKCVRLDQEYCGRECRNKFARGKWAPTFIRLLSQTACITASIRAVGMNTSTVYRYRYVDPEFARQWRKALSAFDGQRMSANGRRCGGVVPR